MSDTATAATGQPYGSPSGQPGPPIDPRVVPAVLDWGTSNMRDLPWRRTRDPWAILVAETMLQQTQVARVIEPYERFLASFPSVDRCAQASRAEVITAWQGLGYNRRAVRLHAAATAITDYHAGHVPDDLERLLALPGIGAYTARAVLVFAYEQPCAVVDTNVVRVLARAVAGARLTAGGAQRLADTLVPRQHPWQWNQLLLDLGATVCTSRNPQCGRCPLAAMCRWRRDGDGHADPVAQSAGASRQQPRFEGSDRQARGRLVAALTAGEVSEDSLADASGLPDDRWRARRLAEALVAEGVAEWDGSDLRLPGDTTRKAAGSP